MSNKEFPLSKWCLSLGAALFQSLYFNVSEQAQRLFGHWKFLVGHWTLDGRNWVQRVVKM